MACGRAAFAVLRASARVYRHSGGDLAQMARRLRQVPRSGSAGSDAALLAGMTEKLLPVLPPWGMGRCWKRALLLQDLYARSGLEPRLHLGIRRREDGSREGHAWVTAPRAVPPSDFSRRFVETWEG